MTARKKHWLIGMGIGVVVAVVGISIAGAILSKRFEPMVRQQAISYLEERFHSQVALAGLHLHLPKISALNLVLHGGKGVKVSVEGDGLSMRFGGLRDLPPLFSVRKVRFVVDLGTLTQDQKFVDAVSLDGMQINIPPKGERASFNTGNSSERNTSKPNVIIKDVQIRGASLVILPKDRTRTPLRFQIEHLHLTSVGKDTPMNYSGTLTNPKPPGNIQSNGRFGPWVADDPGDTALNGKYTFDNADLGVFNGIAGILKSSGDFDGSLSSVHARGEATVPDFRLTMSGNPVPLSTTFEVLVDGINGNTILQPVHAKLGSTSFTTTGAVIKHEAQMRRLVNLKVSMTNGDLRDLLRLATKGSPFMEGRISLYTGIDIPPLTGKIKNKLRLDGRFSVRDAKFLRSNIQDEIDKLSRKGQGQPKNEEIDEVVSSMSGSFRLQNQVMTFRSLSFGVPGAQIALAGDYDLARDTVDFHGTLRLLAKISQTMTGWKRWALKPLDPFFSKNGAGTFLHIKVDGSTRKPKFGLDRGHG